MDFLMIATAILMTIDPVTIGDTQEEDIIEKEVEDLLIEKVTKVEVIQEEEDPLIMGTPEDGGPPDDGGSPGDGRLLRRLPRRQGLTGPPGPPGPVCPIIVQQPQVTLDTTALENTFGTVGQSMLQLARAQDQTN